jgi:tRNA 5-methylaminomethyl-2-thiouridine biosynthesis bifunctional protein
MNIDQFTEPLSLLADFQCLTIHAGEFHFGSDCLDLWQRWRDIQPRNTSRLHIVATSKQLLSRDELATALEHTAHAPDIINRLLTQYPPAISGVHRLIFIDERFSIDLWLGDVVDDDHTPDSIPSLSVTQTPISSSFAIVGAGIAGLSMAHALTRRGYPVVLIEQDQPLSGASGNPCVLLLSKLPKLNRVSSNLQTVGGLTTVRWWKNWNPDVVLSSGALLKIDADDLEKIKGYPTEMVRVVQAADSSNLSGLTCQKSYLFMPFAASIDPRAIQQHVLASPLITLLKANAAALVRSDTDSLWAIVDDDNKTIAQATTVIVANAKNSVKLCPTLPPLTVIRGQISWLAINRDQSQSALKCTIGYGGYTTTFQNNVLLGSSFIRDDLNTELRLSEHESNLNLLKEELPQLAETLPPITTWQGRASLRALPRDSMPLVGSVPQMRDVFVLTGLGSKGFSFAPLCAELLAGQILGEALPMSDKLAAAIHPNRLIKIEKVRKPYYTPPIDLKNIFSFKIDELSNPVD